MEVISRAQNNHDVSIVSSTVNTVAGERGQRVSTAKLLRFTGSIGDGHSRAKRMSMHTRADVSLLARGKSSEIYRRYPRWFAASCNRRPMKTASPHAAETSSGRPVSSDKRREAPLPGCFVFERCRGVRGWMNTMDARSNDGFWLG